MPKVVEAKEPESETVEMTGQELENFIQAQVRISIQKQMVNVINICSFKN